MPNGHPLSDLFKKVKEPTKRPPTAPTVPEVTPEIPIPTYTPAESKIKDIWDVFHLGAAQLWQRTKQYFVSTLPNFLWSEATIPEGASPEQIAVIEKTNKKSAEMRGIFQNTYEKNRQKHQQWLGEHPELAPRPGWEKGVIETFQTDPSTALDPAYWAYIMAEAAPFTLGVLTATIGTTLITGNPFAGLAVGIAAATPAESQDLYEDLVESGATPSQAATLAVPVGAVIGSVEALSDLPLLAAISKPFHALFTRNISKEVAKLTVKGLLGKGLKTFTMVEIAEVTEEVLQGAIHNAAVKTVDEGREILENVPETAVRTAIAVLPFGFLGGGGRIMQERGMGVPPVKKPAVTPEVPIPEEVPAVPEATYYRGGKQGRFITPDREFAAEYGVVKEYTLAPDTNLMNVISNDADEVARRFDFDNAEDADDLWFNPPAELNTVLAEFGYDGFVNDKNIFISNKAKLQPKPPAVEVAKPTVEHLIGIGKKQFNDLSATGRIAPFGGDIIEEQTTNELKAVADGTKPVALIAQMDAAEAKKLGLIVRRVTAKGESVAAMAEVYGAYKKGNKAALDKLSAVFAKEVTGELKGAEMDIALGEALGYSEADIARYLQSVHGSYEEFVEAAKQREPAGVAPPKVKLTGQEKLRATSIGKLKKAQIQKLGVRATVNKVKALGKKIEKMPLRLKADARAVTKDFDVAFRKNKTLKERAKLRKLVKKLEAEGKEVNLPQHTIDLAYKTPLKNLTAQQLDAIHDELDALVTQGLKEMRDMQEARDERIEETVDRLVEHMGIPPEDPAIITRETLKLSKWQKIVQTIQSFTMRTYFVQNIFRMLDGMEEDGLMTRTFSQPIYRAMNTELFDVLEHEDGLRAFMKDYDVSPKAVLRVEKEFKTGIPLTASTRMGAFLGARDNDARLHMELGNKVTAKEITELINQMTPDEIAMADYLSVNFNDASRTLKISEVKELVEGKSLKLVKDWFPIRLLHEAEPQMEFPELLSWTQDQRMLARTATEPGMAAKFVKERTHRAIQPIDLDALSIYMRYIKESSHYAAFAPLISDFRRITKHPKFRKAFIARAGRPALQVVEQWIEDNARGQRLMPRNWAERVLKTARVNAVTAILGWSLTVAPKQFPSFVSGSAEIGILPALHGLAINTMHPLETWKLIKKVSPQMRMRVMERELSLMKLTRNLEKRITGRMTKRELFMIFTLMVDRYTVNSLWVGAYHDYLKKNPGELEAAEEYATKGIIRTQPFFSVKDTAELWRSGELSAALTIFTNQLNRYWNYYRFDIYGKARAGQIGFGTVVKRVLLAFIIPALMISMIARSRPPEDAEDVLTSLADMGLAVVPVAGHWLTAGWKGFYGDSGIVTTEVLDKVQQASYRISKEEWDELALLMPELAGFVTGLPTVQPKRTIKAIIDLASDKSDDWMELIWGSYTRERARKEEEEKIIPGIVPTPEGEHKLRDLFK